MESSHSFFFHIDKLKLSPTHLDLESIIELSSYNTGHYTGVYAFYIQEFSATLGYLVWNAIVLR